MGDRRTVKKGALKREKMSVLGEQQTWAAHCEKEVRIQEEWYTNWSEVFAPGDKNYHVEGRIAKLEAKEKAVREKLEKLQAERKEMVLESSATFKRTSNGELKAAYPFN